MHTKKIVGLRQYVNALLLEAVQSLEDERQTLEAMPDIQVTVPKSIKHGDFSSNIAILLAKPIKLHPTELAKQIIDRLPASIWVDKVVVAGAGFINFFMKAAAFQGIVEAILAQKQMFGCRHEEQPQRAYIEFVSANPTGPLHVGHGRSAAYGDIVANLLEATGFEVHREYYVNDAGRQANILSVSVWLRYLALLGEAIDFPKEAYQGEYIKTLAQDLRSSKGSLWHRSAQDVYDQSVLSVQLQRQQASSPEDQKAKDGQYVDVLIQRARSLLGESQWASLSKISLTEMTEDIRKDLKELGVVFDRWFHESELLNSGALEKGIERLRAAGHLYEKSGALWFKATQFGDDKDRVLIREDGRHTYFAADIAYHLHKYERGYHKIIGVFGADHHGYIPRILGFLKALKYDDKKITLLLVQFVTLYRGKEKLQMSTRSGNFITLRQLREEVGNEATRFFYIMKKIDQPVEFDLVLAKSKSHDNPVYYIQYAHARICRVFEQLKDRGLMWHRSNGLTSLMLLDKADEQRLLRVLNEYSFTVRSAAHHYAPHYLAHYLYQLANCFHSYYNAHQFIVDQSDLRDARLCLIAAVQQVVVNGLALLGIKALQSM